MENLDEVKLYSSINILIRFVFVSLTELMLLLLYTSVSEYVLEQLSWNAGHNQSILCLDYQQ